MNTSYFLAAKLFEFERKGLAIRALAGSAKISDLTAGHNVGRKVVYQQKLRTSAALGEAFAPATPDDAVLFELAVSKTWLRQLTLPLTLICDLSQSISRCKSPPNHPPYKGIKLVPHCDNCTMSNTDLN